MLEPVSVDRAFAPYLRKANLACHKGQFNIAAACVLLLPSNQSEYENEATVSHFVCSFRSRESMNCPSCGLPNLPSAEVCSHCKNPMEQLPRIVAPAARNVVDWSRAKSAAAGAAPQAADVKLDWREQLGLKLERLKEKNGDAPVMSAGAPAPAEDFRQREFVRPSPSSVLELDPMPALPPRREYHPLAEKALQKIDRARVSASEGKTLEMLAEPAVPEAGQPADIEAVPRRKRLPRKAEKTERIEISLNQGMLPFEQGAGAVPLAEESVQTGLSAAPLSPRMRAGAIDAIFVFGCFLIFLLIVFFVPEFAFLTRSSLLGMGTVLLLILLSYIGLFTALGGRTLGMDHEQLELVGFQGTPITPKDAGMRAFGCLVSLGCFGLGFLWAAFDPDRLTWHDKISKTLIVVRNPADAPAPASSSSES